MEKKHKIVSDVILNKSNQETTTSENSPPATRPPERSPSDSSISSCRSYLSHGDGSEHSLHPSPPPPIIYHPPDESVTSVNRSLRNELVPSKKAYAAAAPAAVVEHGFLGGAAEEGGGRGGVSTNATRRPKTTASTTMRRRRSEGAVKKAALGFRVFGFVFCLISFSVMAADRRKGWALDSFDRYIEFRYCLTVNVIGFVYSALQGLNLAYQLSSGKLVSGSHLRYVFEFAFDQMLAYLLISSSSSAAIRADDWKSNWGKDDFPDMASASVAVSFMAFVALASSALISGCIINLANSSPLNKASYVEGSWGGFLNNNSCGGVFDEYLFALAHYANQTGQIFLNSTVQKNCLTTMKEPEVDVLGCGIEKLTSGGGGCSDFSVDDVNRRLGDDVKNLKENCELVNLGGKLDQSRGSCLSSWEDIKGIHSDKGEPTESEAYMCRFAVLVSLTSANIENDIWIQKIDQCLMKQDQVKYKELEQSPETGAGEVKKGKRKISRRLWILIGGMVGVVVIVIVSTWVLLRRHFKSNAPAEKDVVNHALPKDSGHLKVSIKEVYSATNNLDVSNFIGQGTAGKVYKGVLSSNQHVAVKQITDEGYVETFFRELRSLSQVRHPNLVALLGYCEHKDQRFLLYELCPNGNLSEWLFGKDKVLSWISRLKIAIDSARGLWFLHTYPQGYIVHRDIKPSNILLGANFEAKLSDFGLSKVIELGETYMSSEVRGTFGYVDPEYQKNSRVNPAGDVYSFGVVLLQIISGRKVINMNMNTPMPIDKMAKTLTRDGSIRGFADPKLEGEYSEEAFDLTFKLALSCTTLKKERPSMEQVAMKLEAALDISTRAKPSTPHYTPGWSST